MVLGLELLTPTLYYDNFKNQVIINFNIIVIIDNIAIREAFISICNLFNFIIF